MSERLKKYPPPDVHSVIVWTKNPQNMIVEGELRRTLQEYQQIFVHFTITGMGEGEFEPMIPHWEKMVKTLGPLIDLVGSPSRISWRFDPIIKVERNGKPYSNFELFPDLVEAIAPFGIRNCRISWVSPYKKVVTRMAQKGWHLIPQVSCERNAQATQLIEDCPKKWNAYPILFHGRVARFQLYRWGSFEQTSSHRGHLFNRKSQGAAETLRVHPQRRYRLVFAPMPARVFVLLCPTLKIGSLGSFLQETEMEEIQAPGFFELFSVSLFE